MDIDYAVFYYTTTSHALSLSPTTTAQKMKFQPNTHPNVVEQSRLKQFLAGNAKLRLWDLPMGIEGCGNFAFLVF